MPRDDGGQAFPNMGDCLGHKSQGMTLRDYFEIHSLPAVVQQAEKLFQNAETWCDVDYANQCYKIADAMIAERNKNG